MSAFAMVIAASSGCYAALSRRNTGASPALAVGHEETLANVSFVALKAVEPPVAWAHVCDVWAERAAWAQPGRSDCPRRRTPGRGCG